MHSMLHVYKQHVIQSPVFEQIDWNNAHTFAKSIYKEPCGSCAKNIALKIVIVDQTYFF